MHCKKEKSGLISSTVPKEKLFIFQQHLGISGTVQTGDKAKKANPTVTIRAIMCPQHWFSK